MGLILNRRREMGGEALPYDAQIEYLQSTGTQYIDTGVSLASNMSISATYSFTDTSAAWRRLIGYVGSPNTNVFSFCYNTNTAICPRVVSGGVETKFTTYTAGKYTVTLNTAGTISVTGNNYNLNSSFTVWTSGSGSYPIGIFNFMGTNITDGAVCKLYGVTIQNQSGIIMDLIPVRTGTTGYLYDKVSKTLFGNSGSGSFTLGPDV